MSAMPANDIPRFEVSSKAASNGVRMVRIAGELDISHEEEVRAELASASDKAKSGVVVDLTDCEFIDSSGVRALLMGYEAQQEEKGELAVAASSEQILRILGVMGVDKVIPVRPTVDEALAALSG